MRRFTRFLWCCVALTCVTFASRAQLTGTITVPSTIYPTLAAAIDSLNNQGVGTGGVIVNVTANQGGPQHPFKHLLQWSTVLYQLMKASSKPQKASHSLPTTTKFFLLSFNAYIAVLCALSSIFSVDIGMISIFSSIWSLAMLKAFELLRMIGWTVGWRS